MTTLDELLAALPPQLVFLIRTVLEEGETTAYARIEATMTEFKLGAWTVSIPSLVATRGTPPAKKGGGT